MGSVYSQSILICAIVGIVLGIALGRALIAFLSALEEFWTLRQGKQLRKRLRVTRGNARQGSAELARHGLVGDGNRTGPHIDPLRSTESEADDGIERPRWM